MTTEAKSIYLPALGIACVLGIGKKAVAQALFNNNKVDFQSFKLLSEKIVPVGQIPFKIPNLSTAFQSQNSKNNRLLKLALDEISDEVTTLKLKYGATRIGVIMATSTSGMLEEEQGFAQKYHAGAWPTNYHPELLELASPSVFTAQYFGLAGPTYTVSTACSSSGKALCAARRLIQADICDVVITGGADTLCALTLNGFAALELLSETVCNPFSSNRNGITIGEGAAVFLMTREKTSDLSIEFVGGGESSDAYHISSPDPNGEGAKNAIQAALTMASLAPQEIAYINLHGTGTLLNDAMESRCIHQIFGESTPCSSTKALTGHTLGAAGAIEAAFLWLALSHAQDDGSVPIPPHIWDGMPDATLPPIYLSRSGERASTINGRLAMMSNSFAFGGSNVSIILSL
jgi:3-oxoacyl-[acyl-carrier-protein] synthase-1